MNDTDYESSGVFGIGDADVKKECSLDHSRYISNEGNSALHLSFVLFWINVRLFPWLYNTFIRILHIHNTGQSTYKIVFDNEDIIDVKNEPIEVRECILWVCARLIANVFVYLKCDWIGTVIYF